MEKNLNIGIVGTGAIGRTHIERINRKLQGAKVTACADANLDFCRSVAEKYGLKVYENGEDMIADDKINAVIVTTLDAFHEEYVLAAIKAGKFVFCEKPLAPEAQACRRIAEAEIAARRQLVQVGFMRRYDPGYRQLKALIESGEYGSPLMLHCAHRNPDAPGFTTDMPVENSMIHEIDVLRWLIGENYISAEVVFPKTTKYAQGALKDPQIMYLTTESGIRIDVESFVNCRYGYDIKCEVVCEEGSLNLPEPANAMVRSKASRMTPICRDWSERFIEAYNVEFQEWINSCRAGVVNGPSAWDGYLGQVAAKAASKARDTQTRIAIKTEPTPDFYKK
ncbi:Gfo/Idh/MocA family oxidoreductase [Pectinatus haikarae]|uniref:Inositol 2-dehydrogenase/D-chiro-inositol 3-dehydrogenase n=1 Tax=Pectinatus haikarae TaxID=349096 RepID=A0ABT9Y8H6_9FIRM|nr:Gfo/Idh/MocA family oxidoreductase [Pectinatus haikarae]MDQ0204143.1 myo-inositol 2-dehydrogenase/D-chiro-inositol 1-dehydrogenase [Pectinatus haikarae]